MNNADKISYILKYHNILDGVLRGDLIAASDEAVLAERAACAKVCEMCDDTETAIRFIRARGKT